LALSLTSIRRRVGALIGGFEAGLGNHRLKAFQTSIAVVPIVGTLVSGPDSLARASSSCWGRGGFHLEQSNRSKLSHFDLCHRRPVGVHRRQLGVFSCALSDEQDSVSHRTQGDYP
jgi:hypothetical protein